MLAPEKGLEYDVLSLSIDSCFWTIRNTQYLFIKNPGCCTSLLNPPMFLVVQGLKKLMITTVDKVLAPNTFGQIITLVIE